MRGGVLVTGLLFDFVSAHLLPVGCATDAACCTGEIREHSVFSVRGIVPSTEESPSFTAGRMSMLATLDSSDQGFPVPIMGLSFEHAY